MYNKVTEKDIDFLREVTAPDRVLVGDAISEDYSHDELAGVKAMPEVLVRVPIGARSPSLSAAPERGSSARASRSTAE